MVPGLSAGVTGRPGNEPSSFGDSVDDLMADSTELVGTHIQWSATVLQSIQLITTRHVGSLLLRSLSSANIPDPRRSEGDRHTCRWSDPPVESSLMRRLSRFTLLASVLLASACGLGDSAEEGVAYYDLVGNRGSWAAAGMNPSLQPVVDPAEGDCLSAGWGQCRLPLVRRAQEHVAGRGSPSARCQHPTRCAIGDRQRWRPGVGVVPAITGRRSRCPWAEIADSGSPQSGLSGER